MLRKKEYQELPNFIKNWNECRGWRDIESSEDLITENELEWLISIVPEINEQHKQNLQESVWDYDCINDLLEFFIFIKNNSWELRICEE